MLLLGKITIGRGFRWVISGDVGWTPRAVVRGNPQEVAACVEYQVLGLKRGADTDGCIILSLSRLGVCYIHVVCEEGDVAHR